MNISQTILISLLTAASASAQADAPHKFDVASIKPAAPGARGMFIRPIAGGGDGDQHDLKRVDHHRLPHSAVPN